MNDNHHKEAPAKIKDAKKTLLRLSKYLTAQKGLFIFSIIAIVLATIFQLIGPFLIAVTIDDFLIPKELTGLGRISLLMIGVYVLSSLFYWLQDILTSIAAQRISQKLRQELFDHLLSLPLKFFDKRPFGEVMSRMTNDITNITNSLSDSMVQVVSSVLSVVGAVFFMFYLSPIFALITIAIIPLTIIISQKIVKKSGQYFAQQASDLGKLNAYIEEMVTGQKTIKVFTRETKTIEKFAEKNDQLRNSGFKAQLLAGTIPVLMGVLTNLNYVIIAVAGGYLAIKGQISIGVLTSFIQYSNLFTRPLATLATQVSSIQNGIASAERVFEVLDEQPEKDKNDAFEMKIEEGGVIFEKVGLAYEADKFVLNEISFEVKPGETVALVGPTGSGKTSIANLISRFYDVTLGKILVNNQDLSRATIFSVRKQMAVVLQDTRLFATTVRENIRFGRLGATDEEVEKAAKMAAAHGFIKKLAKGYDTKLKVDGENLSQGQRQLIAIARTILADPKILILDEATASIDTLTEQLVQQGMKALKKDRTTILIAHRLSTVKDADLIVVMKNGGILEKGNHRDLLKQKGFYWQIYNSQFESADFDLLEE